MKKLIRLQWLLLKKDWFVFLCLLSCCLISIIFTNLFILPELQDCCGGIVTILSLDYSKFMVILYVVVMVPYWIASDFETGIIHIVLTAGTARRKLFLLKSSMAMLLSCIGAFILFCIPAIYYSLSYGWGTLISIKGYVLRLLLAMGVVLRFSAVMVLLSFIWKKLFYAIGNGVLLVAAEMWLSGTYRVRFEAVPLMTAFSKVFNYSVDSITHFSSCYSSFQVAEEIKWGQQFEVLAVSGILVLLCLTVGYGYFKTDDV